MEISREMLRGREMTFLMENYGRCLALPRSALKRSPDLSSPQADEDKYSVANVVWWWSENVLVLEDINHIEEEKEAASKRTISEG